MKKLFLLTKMLLVMTLLCVGTNAWGGDVIYYLNQYGPYSTGGSYTNVGSISHTDAGGWVTGKNDTDRLQCNLNNALAVGDKITMSCRVYNRIPKIYGYDASTSTATESTSMSGSKDKDAYYNSVSYTVAESDNLVGKTAFQISTSTSNGSYQALTIYNITVTRTGNTLNVPNPSVLSEKTTINFSNELASTDAGELTNGIGGSNYYLGAGMVVEANSETIDGVSYTKGIKAVTAASDKTGTAVQNAIMVRVPAGYGRITLKFKKASGYNYYRYEGGTVSAAYGNFQYSNTRSHSFTYSTSTETQIYISARADNKYDSQIIFYSLTWEPMVSKTISSAGWSTYCSPYALDFSSSIANLEGAYIITGNSGNTLTLSDAITTTVPANTGLLLKGTASTAVTIPVAATGSYDTSGNKLVGVTTSGTKLAAEGGYVLMTDPELGFYKNNNEFTLSANSAYLPTANVSAARSAYFFGGITGVEAVEAKAEAAEKDGKFVINGQLVIKKNGKMFNANGAQMK